MERQQGTVTTWNDERGFGFIAPDAGGPRVFVHVSAFPRGRRPVLDDLVTYELRRDERDRLNAAAVAYVVTRRAGRSMARGLPGVLALATLFLTALAGLVVLGELPVWVPVGYGVLSVVAFTMYRADKVAAESQAWRVPEANLHAVALLGGWPGALVARRAFRHKTRKQPFRTIFWATVVANCAVLGWFVYGDPLGLI